MMMIAKNIRKVSWKNLSLYKLHPMSLPGIDQVTEAGKQAWRWHIHINQQGTLGNQSGTTLTQAEMARWDWRYWQGITLLPPMLAAHMSTDLSPSCLTYNSAPQQRSWESNAITWAQPATWQTQIKLLSPGSSFGPAPATLAIWATNLQMEDFYLSPLCNSVFQ